MNSAVDPTLRDLNDCGCCEGLSTHTPVQVYNRPGLTAVTYRVGTHARFKHTLLARLSSSRQAALRALNTRDDDDFSIALLDAWATVADVLTFYQERFANESYLRTARERLSVLELVRLIDYELRPGVAASTYLAFTLEEAPGALGQALSLGTTAQRAPEPLPPITIDIGTKVQSIPGPGEQAQTFETVEKIEARAEWSAIKPRLTERHPIKGDADRLLFDGLTTNLKPGDGLLLFPDDGSDPVFRRIAAVTLEVKPENQLQRTDVQLETLTTPTLAPASSATDALSIAAKKALNPGPVTGRFLNSKVSADDFQALAQIERFEVQSVFANLTAIQEPPPSVFALRTRAAIFGHNAPRWGSLPVILRIGEYAAKPGADESPTPPLVFTPGPYSGRDNDWVEQNLANYPDPNNEEPADSKNIYLDSVYPSIAKDSWVVLKDGTNVRAYQVMETAEVSKSDFTLSAKVSRLTLHTRNGFELFNIRKTTVFAQSEELVLARRPIEIPVSDAEIELDTWVDGLFTGQNIIVCGELDTVRGVSACELATIDNVEQVLETEGFTRLTLSSSAALKNAYIRDTVTINANIALATHGETIQGSPGSNGEVLGGGDASQPFQRFTLRQPPLTYVSASTPSGAQTTLEVRVDDLLWHEVPTFFGRGPDERIYVTSIDDDGKTTVMFGDGLTGTRLPTGQENVKAKYRKGIGLPGLVKAHQLTQLMTRPLGVKGVTNPLAPSGAADRESLDDSRRNAPLTVLTVGRIVSLQDYGDFARAFSGIDKALATWSWSGEKRSVFVTVAGSKGAEVPSDSVLSQNLVTAMRQAGDPNVPLLVASYELRLFRLSAALQVHPEYTSEKVVAAVEQRLRESFSFEARSFGQPVHLSEIIAVMQNVPGVVAVDVNELYRTDQPAQLRPRLDAAAPRPGDDKVLAAELLTLDPRPLGLEVLP